MKRIAVMFLLLPLLLCGCFATLKPGEDPLVVRSQQAEQVAFTTFDTYLRLVHEHEARVRSKVPAAFKFAEWLRAKNSDGTARGLAMVTSLSNVRRAYAVSRTAANKASLTSALAAVTSAISEAQKHLAVVQP